MERLLCLSCEGINPDQVSSAARSERRLLSLSLDECAKIPAAPPHQPVQISLQSFELNEHAIDCQELERRLNRPRLPRWQPVRRCRRGDALQDGEALGADLLQQRLGFGDGNDVVAQLQICRLR